MSRSPARILLFGAPVVLAVAASFVVGIHVGERSTPLPAFEGSFPVVDLAASGTCPQALGPGSTRAAVDRAGDCVDAATIQSMLLEAGAVGANVHVETRDSGALLGPERYKDVTVQVFLPDALGEMWDARAAARAIALSVGTSTDHVKVLDESLEPLFDGGKTARVRPTSPTRATPTRTPR